jgi:hypothetical protein
MQVPTTLTVPAALHIEHQKGARAEIVGLDSQALLAKKYPTFRHKATYGLAALLTSAVYGAPSHSNSLSTISSLRDISGIG